MSRQDRLSADLERGFSALEAGELEDAAAAVERCQRIDRKRPEVIALAAAVADASLDVEGALALYRSLIELTPDDPMPRICAARLELRDLGDPEAALDTVDAAFDYIDEERDLIEAIVIRTEALIATDDLDSARGALAELSSSVIDDPEVAFDLAELALAAEDPSSAARWIEIVQKTPDGPPGIEADALHLLGRIHESTGNRAEMIAAWQKVRTLDLAAPPGPVAISEDEIEAIASRALAELPAEVRTKLERVPIMIDDVPSEALVAEGTDPRVLGLFQGTPLPDGGDHAPSITTILLFRKNLERVSVDLDQLADEVRITVLHETAHYFGLDEEDLEKLGLD